jgi:dehydrogenase/reductase SDR family member 12
MTGSSLVHRVVDTALEATVVPSFTRIGPAVRRRTANWEDIDEMRCDGRRIVVTGATSGLGLATALRLARMGADLVLVGRDRGRLERTEAQVAAAGNGSTQVVVADLGDLVAVRAAATEIVGREQPVDVLVHNAGALTPDRRTAPDGSELTVASQVYGPFLLTALLQDALRRSSAAGRGPARVITVSSGGMYASPLVVDDLEMGADYRGAEQYARAKRAQVTLNEMWADRPSPTEVVFHAMHPGWSDTPGVATSLPTFRRVVGPLLRSPEVGADTIVWLAVSPDPAVVESSGRFWLDRQVRSIHRLGRTRRSDTATERAKLWQRCCDRTGIDIG